MRGHSLSCTAWCSSWVASPGSMATAQRRLVRTVDHLRPRRCANAAGYLSTEHEPGPAPIFEPSQHAEIAEHFERAGFALIRALDADQVARVNAWIDQSQESCPAAWLGSRPGSNRGGAHDGDTTLPARGTISYSMPLLDPRGAELDDFVTTPSMLPVINVILGGEACFSEFDFRETRDRDDNGQMLFHHDFGAAGASAPELVRDRRLSSGGHRTDYACTIVYLTDVDASSPAFAVVSTIVAYPTQTRS